MSTPEKYLTPSRTIIFEGDPEFAKDYEEKMKKLCLEKSYLQLPCGRRGYTWGKIGRDPFYGK